MTCINVKIVSNTGQQPQKKTCFRSVDFEAKTRFFTHFLGQFLCEAPAIPQDRAQVSVDLGTSLADDIATPSWLPIGDRCLYFPNFTLFTYKTCIFIIIVNIIVMIIIIIIIIILLKLFSVPNLSRHKYIIFVFSITPYQHSIQVLGEQLSPSNRTEDQQDRHRCSSWWFQPHLFETYADRQYGNLHQGSGWKFQKYLSWKPPPR